MGERRAPGFRGRSQGGASGVPFCLPRSPVVFGVGVRGIFESRRTGAVWRMAGVATLLHRRFVAGVGGLSCPAVLAAGSKGFGRPLRLRPFDADQAFCSRGELGRIGWSMHQRCVAGSIGFRSLIRVFEALLSDRPSGRFDGGCSWDRVLVIHSVRSDARCPVGSLLSRPVTEPRRKTLDEGLSKSIEGFPWILWIQRPRCGCLWSRQVQTQHAGSKKEHPVAS